MNQSKDAAGPAQAHVASSRSWVEVGVLSGLAVVGLVMLVTAPDSTRVSVTDLLGPAWFPRVLGVALLVGSLWQLARPLLLARFGRTTRPSATGSDDAEQGALVIDSRRVALLRVGIVVAYLVTLPILGFIVSTVLAVVGLVSVWLRRVTIPAVVYALVITMSTYYVFSSVLNVRLP